MNRNYVSISDKIKRTHAMKNALPCMEFKFDINPYLGYWYAEERLYLIVDCMVDCYYFIEANSPYDAIAKILKRHEEAEHAGEYAQAVETDAELNAWERQPSVLNILTSKAFGAWLQRRDKKQEKRGEWILDHPSQLWECTNCHEREIRTTDFCPWCGADMRKEVEE